MDNTLFRRILIIITFTVALVALVVKFDGILLGILKAMSVMQPLILGGVIAFILKRPYTKLRRLFTRVLPKKWSNKLKDTLALASTYLLFVGLAVALVTFVIPQFYQSMHVLYDNMDLYLTNFENLANTMADYLKISEVDLSAFEQNLNELPALVGKSLSGLLPGVYNFATSIIGSLLNLVLGLILSLYILSDIDKMKKASVQLIDLYIKEPARSKLNRLLVLCDKTFGNFIGGQLTEAVILGVLCFIGMLIFNFEYPLLISVLIGVTSVIPVVGAAIGLIPSLFILLLISPMQALFFAIYIFVLMQIEGNVIYPRVVGGSIGLPSLWVLSAIIVGGGLFGILGMLIGIPLASVAYQLIKDDVYVRSQKKTKK